MKIELLVSGISNCVDGELDFDPAFDNARSLIGSVCQVLHDSEVAEFIVSGFGQERWPVDVFADLPTFLEQLPLAFQAIDGSAEDFDIEFYEQGIERTICFKRNGEQYELTCQSLTDWQPSKKETISSTRLREIFEAVKNEFLKSAYRVAMTQNARRVFEDWGNMGAIK